MVQLKQALIGSRRERMVGFCSPEVGSCNSSYAVTVGRSSFNFICYRFLHRSQCKTIFLSVVNPCDYGLGIEHKRVCSLPKVRHDVSFDVIAIYHVSTLG